MRRESEALRAGGWDQAGLTITQEGSPEYPHNWTHRLGCGHWGTWEAKSWSKSGQEVLVGGTQLAAGRAPAWGCLHRQHIDHIGPDPRSLWLLMYFSPSLLTGPQESGELQPAAGWGSREGDRREPRRSFQAGLGSGASSAAHS